MNREPDWSLWRSFAAVVDARLALGGGARTRACPSPRWAGISRRWSRRWRLTAVRAHAGRAQGQCRRRCGSTSRCNAAQAALAAGRDHGRGRAGRSRRHGAADGQHGGLQLCAARPAARRSASAIPSIAIEIVPSDSAENLLLREADIAIRMFRPTQLELVTRKLGRHPDRRLRPPRTIWPGAARPTQVEELYAPRSDRLRPLRPDHRPCRPASAFRCGATISPCAPTARPISGN